MKKFVFMIITTAVLFALTGVAMADTGMYPVPETQGIVTSTIAYATGTVTGTGSIVWQTGDGDLHIPPLGIWNITATMSYTEHTIADQGHVEYTKAQSLDTAGMVAGTYNFNTRKLVDFIGLDTGRMLSDENLLLDIADYGYYDTSNLYLCPFASAATPSSPGYCNIIEAGSSVDTIIASLSTSADERHVMETGDPAVAVDYRIRMTGFGDIPATGSATAYLNAHLQEARVYEGDKAEDLVYSETSIATGKISLFDKVISYQSGLRRY